MVYVTSDLHGYPLNSFKALLDKAGFSDDDFLFVIGDVIDRNGDGGIAMLRWMMLQPNVELIRGNHEQMLLECDFIRREVDDTLLENLEGEQIEHLMRWLSNGADPTIASIRKLMQTDPDLCEAIYEYLRETPFFETVSVPNGEFVLTHAGLGNFAPDKEIDDYTVDELLWHRPRIDEAWFPDRITVFGHTPTQCFNAEDGRMLRTGTWIDIDTGAAGGGSPMLLRLDDLTPFYAQ